MKDMNTTDNAPHQSHPADQPADSNAPQADSSSQVTAFLREVWRTRPVRIPGRQGSGAWFAGIAEGLGVRYQISPVLIRLLFVVLSLAAGIGVVTYLALLLILPRYTVPLSPAEAIIKGIDDKRFNHDRSVGWSAGIILLIMLVGSFVTVESTTVLGAIVVCLTVCLLHARVPEPPGQFYATAFSYSPKPSTSTGGVSFTSATNPYGSYTSGGGAGGVGQKEDAYTAAEGFEDNARAPQSTPPSWDPLGTAPFAWHLPDPDELDAQAHARPQEKSKKRKKKSSRVLAATFTFIAILAVAGVGAVAVGAADIIVGSGNSSLRIFGTDTQKPTAKVSERKFRLWATNGKLDFEEYTQGMPAEPTPGTPTGNSVYLHSVASHTEVEIPRETDGPAFTVTTYCPWTFLAESECEDGRIYEVPSTAKNQEPKYMVDLHISGTMASVSIERP